MHKDWVTIYVFALCFICFVFPFSKILWKKLGIYFLKKTPMTVGSIEHSVDDRDKSFAIAYYKLIFTDGSSYYGKKLIPRKNIDAYKNKCEILEGKQISVFKVGNRIAYLDDSILKPNIVIESALVLVMLIPTTCILYFMVTGDNLIFRLFTLISG